MNQVTEALIDALDEAEVASKVADLIEAAVSRKAAAKAVRTYLTEVLPNGSVRVRSLFNASGEVPMLYAALMRAALASVQWKKLVDEAADGWGLDIAWKRAYPEDIGNEQGTDDGSGETALLRPQGEVARDSGRAEGGGGGAHFSPSQLDLLALGSLTLLFVQLVTFASSFAHPEPNAPLPQWHSAPSFLPQHHS